MSEQSYNATQWTRVEVTTNQNWICTILKATDLVELMAYRVGLQDTDMIYTTTLAMREEYTMFIPRNQLRLTCHWMVKEMGICDNDALWYRVSSLFWS